MMPDRSLFGSDYSMLHQDRLLIELAEVLVTEPHGHQ